MRKIVLLGLLFIETACSADKPPSAQKMDELAETTLKEWNIPGLSLAVVHKGWEMRVAGYGVKRRGETAPVDADTLFQIASLTKAFTALTVNTLVEEGKLEWEQPIRTYLPAFQLKDPVAVEQMTLRDLLSHRTGLPGVSKESWRLWYNTGRSTEDLLHRLSFVDPAYPFRAHFTYSNMAYVVAGQIVAEAAGMPWEEFCRKTIFEPLGMKRTNIGNAALSQDNNIAAAHLLPLLHEKPIPWANVDSVAAGTGINSCARDMARWLMHCLSNPSVRTTQQPQTLFEAEGVFIDSFLPTWPIYTHQQKIANYGYGWMVYTLGDKQIFFHTGLNDGMQSILAIVPQEELGIAILTNEEPQLGAACLLNQLLDEFLHLEKVDWHSQAHAVVAGIDKSIQQQKEQLQASRNKKTQPTLPLDDYVGEYVHPAYGSIFIRLQKTTLAIELFSHEEGHLQHWQNDQFVIENISSSPPLPWLVEFQLSPDRKQVVSLKMPDLGHFTRQGV